VWSAFSASAWFTVGSAANLTFPDASFDAVLSTDVLEHLLPAEVNRAVGELCRVSRRYLFLRIAHREGVGKTEVNRLKAHGQGVIGGKLHTSILPHSVWRKKF
jgi:ubiquinone/menaquinone biosynthesis C-methylase UbiE